MFCYQCQEAKGGIGCDFGGVCGKSTSTAVLQDVLLYAAKELAFIAEKTGLKGQDLEEMASFLQEALFVTVTNVNFDDAAIWEYIEKTACKISQLIGKTGFKMPSDIVFSVVSLKNIEDAEAAEKEVFLLNEKDEDIRSLDSLLIYGLKGAAAYARHAAVLGYRDKDFDGFMIKALSYSFGGNKEKDVLLNMVLECGKYSCSVLALLDKANTETFGKQEPSSAPLSIKEGPSILVSGHDMQDLYELLSQAEGKGVNVYTHGEMLTAHAYPKLKKFKCLAGHFGTAWHNQRREFKDFTGPILFTTNCIQKPDKSYGDRLFTTGTAGYPGAVHIKEGERGNMKDFYPLIEAALKSEPMKASSEGFLQVGFGKDAVMASVDKIVEAIKNGDITKFVVMAGCDGHMKSREYFTEIAEGLSKSAVILTAGCAKFRYNGLDLGDINGIPRLLDAGQCNDSYSIAYIALKLKEVFGLDDINKLPVAFDVAWYEQKAVTVLLALLHLGFKNIRLGPTLPAFLSPAVAGILKETFGITSTGEAAEDLKAINA